MALPVEQQAKYWGIATVVFCLALWFLGDVLLPFIVGGAIAYMMDPVADRLERLKFSRVMATTTISLIAILVIVPVFIFVVREVTDQTAALMQQAPKYLTGLYTYLSERFPALMDETSTLSKTLRGFGTTLQERGTEVVKTVFSSALGVINAAVFVVVS